MNVDTDQAIPINSTKWVIRRIIITNASLNLTTAVGGFYPAASKAGTAIVANSQVYSSLTAATVSLDATLAANQTIILRSISTVYFSLTTPQGAAATADIYVIGDKLD